MSVKLIHPVCTRKKFNLCLSAERDVFFCLILTKDCIERNDFKAGGKLLKRHFYCIIAFSHRGKKCKGRARERRGWGWDGGCMCSPRPPAFPDTNLRRNTWRAKSLLSSSFAILLISFKGREFYQILYFFLCLLIWNVKSCSWISQKRLFLRNRKNVLEIHMEENCKTMNGNFHPNVYMPPWPP